MKFPKIFHTAYISLSLCPFDQNRDVLLNSSSSVTFHCAPILMVPGACVYCIHVLWTSLSYATIYRYVAECTPVLPFKRDQIDRTSRELDSTQTVLVLSTFQDQAQYSVIVRWNPDFLTIYTGSGGSGRRRWRRPTLLLSLALVSHLDRNAPYKYRSNIVLDTSWARLFHIIRDC